MHHSVKTAAALCAVFLFCFLKCMPARSTASPHTGSSELRSSSTDGRRGSGHDNPATEIIEKRRFVDMARLQGEEQRLVNLPLTKRPEVIMPGDQLEITLYEKLPVSQEKRIEMKRVEDDGTVFIYPFDRLTLAGMTLTEARKMIERKMESYIVSPFCEITLMKRAYEPKVFVFGEAIKPGMYPLHGGERLLDILSLAGGATPKAYTASIKLVRVYRDSVGVMSINVNDILKRGHIENNLVMQDQDVVFLPTRLFTSVAEVMRTLVDVLPWYYFVKNF